MAGPMEGATGFWTWRAGTRPAWTLCAEERVDLHAGGIYGTPETSSQVMENEGLAR